MRMQLRPQRLQFALCQSPTELQAFDLLPLAPHEVDIRVCGHNHSQVHQQLVREVRVEQLEQGVESARLPGSRIPKPDRQNQPADHSGSDPEWHETESVSEGASKRTAGDWPPTDYVE